MGRLRRASALVVAMRFLIAMRIVPISFALGRLMPGGSLGLVLSNLLTDSAQFAVGEQLQVGGDQSKRHHGETDGNSPETYVCEPIKTFAFHAIILDSAEDR
jgi:hypothetical protein